MAPLKYAHVQHLQMNEPRHTCQLSDLSIEAKLIKLKHICLNMNLYDNYSDLFLLSKLVDASRTPCPRAICLELSWETDDNLNFVSTQIHLCNSIEFVVTVCLD